jgi:hypothetical protein
MRHRLAMLAMALTAVLGTGVAVAPGPAQAAPAISLGPYSFYVSGTSNCIITHGVGNQLTVQYDGNCAQITLTFYVTKTYTFTDGSGNCIRANSSDVVLVESGSCHTSDTAELWIVTAGDPSNCNSYTNPCRFENQKQGLWLKVTGPASGDKVWVGTGGYNNWVL